MSAQPSGDEQAVNGRELVARGAGLAFLSKLGALIEVVNQPVFTRLFGLATYGLYVVLWSYVRLLTAITELAMTSALQRYGAGARDEDMAHSVVKLALLATTVIATFIAIIVTLAAPYIADIFNAAEADRAHLPLVIRLYAWTLPLWTVMEIGTSAVRARRAFGPEIRIRIFYEQISRLIFAVSFFLIGWGSMGLFAAHVASLGLASILSIRLLFKYYDWRRLIRVPVKLALSEGIAGFSLLIVPTHLIQRAFSELPPVLLNLLLPGAAGAEAAGLYGIARKIASVLHIVRLSFEYVLAPLAAVHASVNWAEVKTMYGYATRLATIMILPLSAGIIIAREDIAALFGQEAIAAAPLIIILTLGRCFETLSGPASALLEVLGKRGLPLANNVAGLIILIAVGALLTPTMGAQGVAIGTAIALVSVAFASLGELGRMRGLHPFSAGYVRALGWGLGAAALMLACGLTLDALAGFIRLAVVLGLYILFALFAARMGLRAEDRAAFRRSKAK